MSAVSPAMNKLLGLFEIDTAGTILYSRIELDGAAHDVTGRNFYTDVAAFANVGEFRQRLDTFSQGSLPAGSMDFNCLYDDGALPVRVLFTRIRERTSRELTKSILIHIRRAK
jgi:hypothetical protein